MTERDRIAFAEAFLKFFLSKGREPSELMADVWMEDLMDFEIDVVTKAFAKARRAFIDFPQANHIIEICKEIREASNPLAIADDRPTMTPENASEAWAKLRERITPKEQENAES
jgi:hypothetical protein